MDNDTPITDAADFFKAFEPYALRDAARKLELENRRLRAIFPRILEALESGACSPTCSVEFMEQIPDEVRLVMRELRMPNVKVSQPHGGNATPL